MKIKTLHSISLTIAEANSNPQIGLLESQIRFQFPIANNYTKTIKMQVNFIIVFLHSFSAKRSRRHDDDDDNLAES